MDAMHPTPLVPQPTPLLDKLVFCQNEQCNYMFIKDEKSYRFNIYIQNKLYKSFISDIIFNMKTYIFIC